MTGSKIVKCHGSRGKAEAHMRALYANVEDAKIAIETELKRGIGLLKFIQQKIRPANSAR